jgi:hypothetical protein
MEMLRSLIGPDNGDATAAQLGARALILFVIGIAYIRSPAAGHSRTPRR